MGGMVGLSISSLSLSTPPPDLPSLLLDQRIVYIGTPLTPKCTEIVIGELLWLNFSNPNSPISAYINSTGSYNAIGEVVGFDSEAYAILDTLKYIRPDYNTLCVGNAFGNAAMLLASGKKGMRSALPNARIVTCPPKVNRSYGRIVDQMILTQQLDYTHEEFIEIFSKVTERHNKDIRELISRNKYWTTKSAVEFGIIDRVLDPEGILKLDLHNYLERQNATTNSSKDQNFNRPNLDPTI